MNSLNSSVGQGFVTDALLAAVQHRCSFGGNVSPVGPPPTHRAGKAFAALTLFALLSAHGAVNAQPDADTKTHFDEAMSLYEQCQWTPAFEQLVNLANGGHAEAARVALMMSRYGPALYGSQFATNAWQRERWLAVTTLVPPPVVLHAGY